MTTSTPPDAEQITAAILQGSMRAVAARLRDIADAVDKSADAVDQVPSPGAPRYSWLAAQVQHTIAQGLADASLERLIKDAAEADEARLEKRATP
ncbi:hypothetical protein [Cellulosimicrobium cellulans]|uniref:hypothetical protein n=1 Tax=Cellulosimicrobium cellulans TaxID=1710 RepID=UPI00030E6DEF|nr:hypothetical protein [Cellulosimicrobium cellulans]